MSSSRLPKVRDEFSVRQEQLGTEWFILASYGKDQDAFWKIPSLQYMPWEKMPRTEGSAVCFARGGEENIAQANAVLFMNNQWYHILMQEVKAKGNYYIVKPS